MELYRRTGLLLIEHGAHFSRCVAVSSTFAFLLASLTSERNHQTHMILKLDYPRSALTVERDLLKNLAEKDPTFAEISHNISELVLYSCVLLLVARN